MRPNDAGGSARTLVHKWRTATCTCAEHVQAADLHTRTNPYRGVLCVHVRWRVSTIRIDPDPGAPLPHLCADEFSLGAFPCHAECIF